MRIVEMLNSVQFVVDKDGRHTAVQLELKTWQMLPEKEA